MGWRQSWDVPRIRWDFSSPLCYGGQPNNHFGSFYRTPMLWESVGSEGEMTREAIQKVKLSRKSCQHLNEFIANNSSMRCIHEEAGMDLEF